MEIRPRWLHHTWVLKLRYAADFEVEPLSCMTVAVVCRPCCMFLFTSSFFFFSHRTLDSSGLPGPFFITVCSSMT